MPTPLIASPNQLAKASVNRTPMFAAALAIAGQEKKPVMVDTHFSKSDIQSGRALLHSSTVARWAAAVATAGTIMLTAGPALTGLPVVQQVSRSAEHSVAYMRAHPETQHFLSRIGERYKRLIGPPENAQRLRTMDQLVEDRLPAAPGQTSGLAMKVSDISSEKSKNEMVIAAGAILGVGFENLVNSEKSNGMFEANLLKQLTNAMKVVAPGKLLSEMTDQERNAVLTATMYSTNGSFMKIMSDQSREFADAMRSPEGALIKNAAESIPTSSQYLNTFVKNGAFSMEAFNKEISSLIAKAPNMAGTSAASLKARLLATVALKAGAVMQAMDATIVEMGVPSINKVENNPVTKFMSNMSMRLMEKIAGMQNEQDDKDAPRPKSSSNRFAAMHDNVPNYENDSSLMRAPRPSI